MAEPMSDEELYQLTGSWEAAAALRDQQRQAPAANVAAPSGNFTLDDLKSLYKEKGATSRREEETEQGTKYYDDAVQYGNGWSAFENDNRKIIDYIGQGMDATPVYDDAPKTLGGFSKQEGDYVYNYDPEGKFLGRIKWNESDLKNMWDYLGPIAMGAITMGGGAGALGSYLFPSLGATAAAGAGGALAGGFNAAMTDQDILKGALRGGAGSAGALQLGDTGFTLGDATKALNFAQNPSLTGAANLFAPSIGGTQIGDTGISLNDVFKGVGTAQALGSGNNQQIFNALTGLAKDQGGSLKSSLAGFDANPDDFIEGYFRPGGEGYIDPTAQEMTVREDPENLDAFLRSISPYATDEGKSVFVQDEDIPEFETVSNRPITSLDSILGTPDILEEVPQDDEPYVSKLRTKEIKSAIPDELTVDDIDKLFPDIDFNDILQTVVADGTKTVTPDGTKTVVPTKTTTPGTKTTEQSLTDLGLNAPMPSQDPYANIKLMEELFGGDMAYKLRALGAPKNLASADIDALARMLRG
jgi:hypothetical protein